MAGTSYPLLRTYDVLDALDRHWIGVIRAYH